MKTQDQLEKMRKAGGMVGELLEVLKRATCPGISTLELDALAEGVIRRLGGKPAFKGYRGFPANICTSVNEEVVHGIPSRRRLRQGDIVGIDAGVVVEGYYADAAVTVAVETISPQAEDLMRVTQLALAEGIAMARPGRRLSDISHAVQKTVESHGYSVVREFVGHGIGRELHESPQIPNYGSPGYGPVLKAGMCLAIEPMVNQGAAAVEVMADGWTAVTKDRRLSAHFEHTIAVTENEPEVLTECPKKS